MTHYWKQLLLLGAAAFAVLLLIACTPRGITTASCGFLVGDGHPDAELHRIIYPGQTFTQSSDEVLTYVPCNSRNYLINDGSARGPDNKQVGDRHTPIEAVTDSETTILLSVSAFWTLNQSESAMRKFYTVCHKYSCALPADKAGTTNFASDGWNGMLAENFGPSLDKAGQIAARQVKDSIWKSKDPEEAQKLADGMSAAFGDAVRARLGFSEDLFCGSGNSAWRDPSKPGQGEFTCSPVRIVVDSVTLKPSQGDQSSQSLKAINDLRYSNAVALYGPDAGFWLGLQDSIDRCKGATTPCMFNVGGSGGGPALPVPAARNLAPAPTPAVPSRN